MKVNVYSKDITVSQDLQERIGDKLSFLDKYLLIDPETIAQAIVKKQGNDIKLEITIPSKIGYLRSESVEHQLEDAIDSSVDKLESQIRRQKTRLSRRHKEKLALSFVEDNYVPAEPETVARTKRVAVDDLDTEEAIMQMELMDHDFFVYRDVNSKVISVLYRRKDGDYGVLEIV